MSTDDKIQEVLRALSRDHNVLLYGPPGTGKSFIMNQVRQAFLNPSPPVLLRDDADTDFLEQLPVFDRPCRKAWWITFHASYSYEDFVVGLRTAAGAGFMLEARQGPLLEAAENGRLPDGASLLLVDEINRGNTARIFGEFITLMESSKRRGRNGSEGPETVMVALPNVPSTGLTFALDRPCEPSPVDVTTTLPFSMPWHVFLLASMNSVDRSVAPLDAAIHRRFYIIELEPDYAELAGRLGITGAPEAWATLASTPESLDYWKQLSVRLLFSLNQRIRSLLGKDYELGQAYLWNIGDETTIPGFRARLAESINTRIVPQLNEMLRGQPDTLGAILSASSDDSAASYPFRFETISEALASQGGRRPLKIDRVTDSNLEKVIRRLGTVGEPDPSS